MSVNKSMAFVVMAVLVFSSSSAAGDAARVAGDLKVDGIHFSVDGSVIRRLSDLSSLWTLLGSDIYYLGGNVGIGTMNPAQKLSVAGTVESTTGGFRFPDGTTQTTAGGATLGPNTFSGTQTLLTGAAANKGLIVKGASGQTANLQEWQNSAGTSVASVSAFGDLTLTGTLNLPVTTAYTGIIMSGADTLIHARGHESFFAGARAGNLANSGSWNTGNGYAALSSIISGNGNTAVGSSALGSNTYGHQNTANGFSALASNTSGGSNTAIGAGALNLNTTGASNTGCGTMALQYNSSGTGNVATGLNALNKNTIGNFNNAYGNASLFANTTGSNNTVVGTSALRENTTGTGNTALGYQAGYTTAPANANTTGTNNTFIGYNSGPGTSSQLTNATAIGYNALVSQSNSLVLGGTGTDAVKVGVGTKTPTEALDVVGNVRINNKDIYLRADTDTNHGLGWYGAGKLFAGSSLDGPALYGFSGGALGTTSDGQQIALAWNNSGNVGIGTATPSERLEVTGTVKATAFSGSGTALTGLAAGNIAGTLAITQGGTGAISSATALTNLGAAAVSHSHDATYLKKPVRVAIVAKEGGDYRDPLIAMNEALDEWCREPAEANPCLLKIMPGVYEIGANSLLMQPYVDIEGSGEETTKIKGTVSSYDAGLVMGASNAELRYLSLENNGPGSAASIAIFNNNASPRISHVTATAFTASGVSTAVRNIMSSPTLKNVSLATSSPNNCSGVYNYDSSPLLMDVSITTGSTCNGYGIHNRTSSSAPLSSPQISGLTAVISGDLESYGIYNEGYSTVSLKNSVITANNDRAYSIYTTSSGGIQVVNSRLNAPVYDPFFRVAYEGVHDFRGKYLTSGASIVRAGSTTSNALTVQGLHGQTTNIQEWWDMEGGRMFASMSPWGVLNLPTDGLSVGWDGNNIYGQFVLAAGKVGIGKSGPTEVLDVLGNIRINDKDVLFRTGTDTLHGLGFYGGIKTFASTDVNGPVLYGNGGGALGSINGAQQIALSWNTANDVAAKGRLTVANIPNGSTSNVLCSSAANSGIVQRCSSTRKLKDNIADLSLGLGTVSKLRPVSFTWKANGNEDIGFIAEEVAAEHPVLAIYNEQGEPDGVKYANMSAVLVKAVQEQQQEIDRQKSRIESQGAMIDELKAELAALKAVMSR